MATNRRREPYRYIVTEKHSFLVNRAEEKQRLGGARDVDVAAILTLEVGAEFSGKLGIWDFSIGCTRAVF